MNWVDHTIWWHVYPLGFCGAPIRGEHTAAPRLRRLLNWLDYAVELGASGLLLGPIFASEAHGYDTLDFYRIDPRLGTDEDFDDLVAGCRARGLHLLLDGVFSHVGAGHPDLRRALAEGPDGDAAGLFDVDWDAPGGPAPRVFEGHGALARLNHGSERTVDLVAGVMSHWLDRGASGWRLDAAYSVDASFWARALPRVREHHPDAWILGEVIHGDYPAFVAASTADSVTQYELWKAVWSSLKDRNFFELDWTLTRHNALLDAFVPNTFVGNHDVTRIASTVGPDLAVVALAILMTVGGTPSIYAGDEQGFTGVKEEMVAGDDAVRPPFPETPAELLPFGEPMLRVHKELIGLRRRHPWLVRARTERLHVSNEQLTYRVFAGDDALEVHLDLTGTPSVVIKAGADTVWSTSAP
ncbi:MAG TPA: alpha-amylase family protein [Arachnia sp.]|jgi:glycosidase|nr:alpha-amylase family protein [Propionibacteriaceae bacterium]HOA28007.1 alpha-amylase family protein [Arachnia sp.]HQD21789.1 alpha-amylase family protein [Arachnia sp.]